MHPITRISTADPEDPFNSYSISDWTILNGIETRSHCPECQKSRKYFCYQCYLPVPELAGKLPEIKLPIKIDIIKHPKEIDGKSTAVHAALLAPKDVRIFTYPDIPDYSHESVAILYPKSKSKTLIEVVKCESKSFERFLLIDSTWNQSKGILKDPRLAVLPTVVIRDRISQFWRHQKKSPRWYLATIEAVHQLVVDYHVSMIGVYDGRYDDLLFLFRFMYDKIHSLYDSSQLLSYKRPFN